MNIVKMIRSSILEPEFHMDFPYTTFPWRLEVNKDNHNIKGIALTVCHFECKEHMEKYLDRYNFKPKDVKISNRYGETYEFKRRRKKTT